MPISETARAQRFAAYVDRLSTALGHRDRHGPLRAYVTGLCLPGERKSIEPMAARVDPPHVRPRHQSMHHFVANAPWDHPPAPPPPPQTLPPPLNPPPPDAVSEPVRRAAILIGGACSAARAVGAPGGRLPPPRKSGGHGRRPTLVRRTGRHRRLRVRALAQHLPARGWRTVTWRAGTRGAMR